MLLVSFLMIGIVIPNYAPWVVPSRARLGPTEFGKNSRPDGASS
jgi:hypothetical protein